MFGGIRNDRYGRAGSGPTTAQHVKTKKPKAEQMMMKSLILMALTLMLTSLSACGTVDGIGRDISGGANRVAGWMG